MRSGLGHRLLTAAPSAVALCIAALASACSSPAPSAARDAQAPRDQVDATHGDVADAQTVTDAGPVDATSRVLTCGWLEVRASADAPCPANATRDGSSACSCRSGWVATSCDATPCDGGRCEGEWYCARSLTDDGARCPAWDVGVPAMEPTLRCTMTPSPFVGDVVSRLSSLWSSALRACPCESDARAYGCYRNAFVFFDTPGVIHYDPELVATMGTMIGDDLAVALVFGHEVGHSVQSVDAKLSGYTIQMEQGADCYAGYFLGALECRGDIDMTGVADAMTAACGWGDRMEIPWWDPQAHGTCEQRTQALLRGLEGYRARRNPALTCRWASGM